MRKLVVVTLSTSLVVWGGAGRARADGAVASSLTEAASGPSAWVLRIPLTFSVSVAREPELAAVAFAAAPPLGRDDVNPYPDPRAMPLVSFSRASLLEQNFAIGDLPLTSSMMAYRIERAWQALDVLPAPIWQSALVVRLPGSAFAGAWVEQRTTAPPSTLVVAGERF